MCNPTSSKSNCENKTILQLTFIFFADCGVSAAFGAAVSSTDFLLSLPLFDDTESVRLRFCFCAGSSSVCIGVSALSWLFLRALPLGVVTAAGAGAGAGAGVGAWRFTGDAGTTSSLRSSSCCPAEAGAFCWDCAGANWKVPARSWRSIRSTSAGEFAFAIASYNGCDQQISEMAAM